MKNLRLLRESFNLSQQKLAVHLDLAQSQIQNYETGNYEPDISTMIKMAEFFGTSVDYLIGRSDTNLNADAVCENACEFALNEKEQQHINRVRRLLPKQRKSLSLFLDTLDGE